MYRPPQKMLEKYAKILVNFALNSGKGVKKGEVIFVQAQESAKELLRELRIAVLKSGAHPIIHFIPDEWEKDFFEYANEDQISFFPDKYLKGRVDQMDHMITILSSTNKQELKDINHKKVILGFNAMKPYIDWRHDKENAGKFTWTLGLFGTEAMAKEAGLSLEKYWEQIIKGCYLDYENSIRKWRELFKQIEALRTKLNKLDIKKLRIEAKDTDLIIGLDKNRQWLGGSGRNIPSFEIFTSPVCRQTEGYISFTEPLYRYGNIIKNIRLEFKNGKVIKARASTGEKVLKEMIKTKGADMVGEFSLTDKRFSRITKFMAETLYDENVGGKYGNIHIALGSAYKDAFSGNILKVKRDEWKKMGYNDSVVHTDIVSTSDRVVTATLQNGNNLVIYKNGQFTI